MLATGGEAGQPAVCADAGRRVGCRWLVFTIFVVFRPRRSGPSRSMQAMNAVRRREMQAPAIVFVGRIGDDPRRLGIRADRQLRALQALPRTAAALLRRTAGGACGASRRGCRREGHRAADAPHRRRPDLRHQRLSRRLPRRGGMGNVGRAERLRGDRRRSHVVDRHPRRARDDKDRLLHRSAVAVPLPVVRRMELRHIAASSSRSRSGARSGRSPTARASGPMPSTEAG